MLTLPPIVLAKPCRVIHLSSPLATALLGRAQWPPGRRRHHRPQAVLVAAVPVDVRVYAIDNCRCREKSGSSGSRAVATSSPNPEPTRGGCYCSGPLYRWARSWLLSSIGGRTRPGLAAMRQRGGGVGGDGAVRPGLVEWLQPRAQRRTWPRALWEVTALALWAASADAGAQADLLGGTEAAARAPWAPWRRDPV